MSIFATLLLITILLAGFVYAVFYLTTRYKNAVLCVCTVFVAVGFVLYTAGYLSSGDGLADALFAALRGIFSTARMFSINEDFGTLTNIQGAQWLTEHKWMRVLLWFSYVSALIIIQTALISLFGRRLVERFRLRFGAHREVYIIKGCDKNALMLGENIATHDRPQGSFDSKRLVVFLIEEDDGAEKIYKKIAHFNGIVKSLDRKYDFEYYLKKTRLGKRNRLWIRKKYHIILMSKDAYMANEVCFAAEFANRKNVHHDDLDIYAFVSSEWDRERIEKITQAKDGTGLRIYPYAIRIINEEDLITRRMIENHPPYKCGGLAIKDGKASKDFTVMMLGFGAMGQRALLRLVMNGQFVGSRMRAIIVDKRNKNNKLRDRFLHRYPAFKSYDNNDFCRLEFHDKDVRCDSFFELLDENENGNIDYIVIALYGDELNKQTALDIRSYYENRGGVIPVIAVITDPENMDLNEKKDEDGIFIFGCREDIYRESVIIREETDRMAKAVHEVYGGNPPWNELEWFLQESNRAAADFIPAMLGLAGRNEDDEFQKDAQFTDNEKLADILAQTEHRRWNAFHAAMGYRLLSMEYMRRRFETYKDKDAANKEKRLDYCRRDSSARLQACLVAWDKLDDVSAAYNELADRVNGKTRNFKKNDLDNIQNIPKFLHEAKAKGNKTDSIKAFGGYSLLT